ncbi:MAG: PQQ-dependent sugar dehydrogenase [Acidobacteriota bacterium]
MRLRRTITAAATLLAFLEAARASAATLPPGFQETIVFSGLTRPTAVRFSPDGRIFVAEKSGLIKVFDSLSSPAPTIFADLRTEVDDYWDRGLLSLALHPNFPTTPYVYALYSYDAPIGGTAPTWNDTCPSPPGATTNGCVISGRLSRLTAAGNHMTGTEEVLLEAWGQQFPSHSVGDLRFGPDGALYVSGGDGASFNNVDYGQYGSPVNPLGDPPVPVGGAQTPPAAEGGALRSQSLLRVEGGPAVANGAILRVDDDGNPKADNPLSGSSDEIARRIIASGLRNPFRFTIQPGTGSLWIGDVGWSTWEEIDRIADPTGGTVPNFGWPCYEGAGKQSGYAAASLTLCENLYGPPSGATAPFFTYKHSDRVVSGESCPTGSSSISGLAFYEGGSYPENYDGALFFSDYSRRCVWVMFPGAGGGPDPSTRATFIAGAATPVDLQTGPGGDLYYADQGTGTIRRIQYFAPTAVAHADPSSGPAPLTVHFDGTESAPAQEGDTIGFAWDLNGDGNYDESTDPQPTFLYAQPGSYTARLRVTDNHGVSTLSDPLTIVASDLPPAVTIDTPAPTLAWKVGDAIGFSGHATDALDGTIPASALTWTVILHHCPSNCHTHTLQTFPGVASGSFSAPDHEYPSYLELQLSARDSGGLTGTASVRLDPQTVALSFASSPPGMQLAVGTGGGTTPFTQTAIVGATLGIAAPSPQTLGATPYQFVAWSDGGAASHAVTAGASAVTYTATYTAADLSLSADGEAQVCVGKPLAYTLTVQNAGPTAASSVSVSATLPAGAALVAASGDGWTCSGSATVVCTRPQLSVGAAPPITISLTAPTAPGQATASVTVSAATSDPNASNNGASVLTAVKAIPAAPTAGSNGPVCEGETLQLTASAVAGATYSWTGPNGFASSLQNPTIPSATPAASGQYSVTVTVDGCTSATATTTVTVKPKPAAPAASSSGTVCQGETLQLTASAVAGATYSWTGPNGFASTLQNPAIPGATPAASGTYTVIATVGGCPSAPSTTAATVNPAPSAVITGPASVCLMATELSASVPDAGSGAVYDWSIGNGTITSGQGTAAIRFSVGPDVARPVTLGVVVRTAAGCSANGSASMPVERCAPEVTEVSPTSGPAAGSTAVDVTGQNFEPSARLWLGAAPAGEITVTVPVEISAMTPPLPPGTLNDVVTRNPDGQSGVLVRGYLADFSDVPGAHPFHRAVEKIFRAGITTGCGGGDFCPDVPVTRAQMAVFLLRGIHGVSYTPPPATGIFGDVAPGDFAAAWIEELSREGITGGCGGGNYCPDKPVDRASEAVLLLRAVHGSSYAPPAATGLFGDVPVSSPFSRWIEELSREGVTTGCGGGNYCPDRPNTRGEMAVFLSRAFGLP